MRRGRFGRGFGRRPITFRLPFSYTRGTERLFAKLERTYIFTQPTPTAANPYDIFYLCVSGTGLQANPFVITDKGIGSSTGVNLVADSQWIGAGQLSKPFDEYRTLGMKAKCKIIYMGTAGSGAFAPIWFGTAMYPQTPSFLNDNGYTTIPATQASLATFLTRVEHQPRTKHKLIMGNNAVLSKWNLSNRGSPRLMFPDVQSRVENEWTGNTGWLPNGVGSFAPTAPTGQWYIYFYWCYLPTPLNTATPIPVNSFEIKLRTSALVKFYDRQPLVGV